MHEGQCAARRPDLTVIFPLIDDRGAGVEATQRWLAQDAPPDSFQLVVVAANDDSPLTQSVRSLLRPHDKLVVLSERNEAQLYNFGARHAQAPLWLFTESHVLPELDVVSSVCRHFACRPREAAATVASGHASRNRVAQVDEALFRREEPIMKAIGAWRTMSLRALAVRANVFERHGPLNEDCQRFAETVFALRLVDAGCQIGWIDSTRMDHVNIQTLSNMAEDLRYGAQGHAAYRARAAAEHLERLGGMPEYSERPWCDGQIARDAVRAAVDVLVRDALRRGCGRRNQRLAKRIMATMPSVVGGARAALAMAGLQAYWRNVRFTLRMLGRSQLGEPALSSLIPEFLNVRLAWVNYGVIEELCERGALPELPRLAERTLSRFADWPDDACLGCTSAESWRGRSVRWTDGFALLRIPVNAADQTIRVGVDAVTSWSQRRCHWFWNGRRLAPERLERRESFVEFRVTADECRAREQTLAIASDLVRLDKVVAEDRRRMGLALESIEVRAASGAARRGPESRGVGRRLSANPVGGESCAFIQ